MTDMKERTEVQYERMSLRHEHVENEKLPKINIFFEEGCEERAEQIAYGVEEEGLPRRIIQSSEPAKEAFDDTLKKGLGVAVSVEKSGAKIYCRQFKKNEAFMEYSGLEKESLRIVGKNSARILKHKPFILEETDDEIEIECSR